jgi:hypothetical protein
MGKATKGNRYANGRLKQPTTKAARAAAVKRDEPGAHITARFNLWNAACIREGKAAHDVFDAIGQLHALDFLDGHGYEASELRDAGRKYAGLYWQRNADKAPKGQTLEVFDKSRVNHDDTRSSLTFEAMIRDLPTYERGVLELVCVDYWFTDEIAPFALRLVTTELLKRKRMPPVVRFEEAGDRDLLAALIRGLCVVHEATIAPRSMQRRAA